jgi:Ca2+-binding RTX toxin-like protein
VGLPKRSTGALALGLAAAAVVVLGAFASPAGAAYTASLSGTTATFTADNTFTQLRLRGHGAGSLLEHNRFSQGDACFESDLDFDCAVGVQTLANVPGSTLGVVGGTALDAFEVLAPNGTAQPRVEVKLNLDGGSGADFPVRVEAGAGSQAVTLEGSRISGATGQPIDYSNLDAATLLLGAGNDSVQVASSPTGITQVFAGADSDTLNLANGTALGDRFLGEAGSDTLDYNAWTAPVTTNLGVRGRYKALLLGEYAVPPTGSTRSGSGFVSIDVASGLFEYDLLLENGFAPADVTDVDIHSGEPGANGPALFDFGPGSGFTDLGGGFLSKNASGQSDPDISDAALRAGSLYLDVHTTGFGAGEIRGQLEFDPEFGYSGTATGTAGVGGIESVIGGAGNDDLTGTPASDLIQGRGGADTIDGGPGNDFLFGGTQNDEVLGGEGSDAFSEDNAANGADLIDGGPGDGDSVFYSSRFGAVAVNLGSNAAGEDGEAGEGDDVRDSVERAYGGEGDDTLVGSAADNELVGGGGADRLSGALGNDVLEAEDGVADLSLDCGGGVGDRVWRDPAAVDPDSIVSGCETVTPALAMVGDPGPPAGPGTAKPPGSTDTLGRLSAIAAKVSGKGARVKIASGSVASCPAAAPGRCLVTAVARTAFPAATLRPKVSKRVLGSFTRELSPGQSVPVVFRVSAPLTAAWRSAGKLKVAFAIEIGVPGGTAATKKGSASLKAPPAKK